MRIGPRPLNFPMNPMNPMNPVNPVNRRVYDLPRMQTRIRALMETGQSPVRAYEWALWEARAAFRRRYPLGAYPWHLSTPRWRETGP